MAKSSSIVGIDLAYALALFGTMMINCYFILGDRQEFLSLEQQYLFFDFFPALFFLLNGATVSLSLRDRRISSRRILLNLSKKGTILFFVGLLFIKFWAMNIFVASGLFFIITPIIVQWNTIVLRIFALALVLLGAAAMSMEIPTFPQFSALELEGVGLKDVFGYLFYNGYYSLMPWLVFYVIGLIFGRGDVRPKGWFPPSSIVGLGLLVFSFFVQMYCTNLFTNVAAQQLMVSFPFDQRFFTPAFILFEAGACLIFINFIKYFFRKAEKGKLVEWGQTASSAKYSIYFFLLMISALLIGFSNVSVRNNGAVLLVMSFILTAGSFYLVELWKSRLTIKPPMEWLIKRLTGSTKS